MTSENCLYRDAVQGKGLPKEYTWQLRFCHVHAGLSANVKWKWSMKNVFKVYNTLNCFSIKCHFYPSVQISILQAMPWRKASYLAPIPNNGDKITSRPENAGDVFGLWWPMLKTSASIDIYLVYAQGIGNEMLNWSCWDKLFFFFWTYI